MRCFRLDVLADDRKQELETFKAIMHISILLSLQAPIKEQEAMARGILTVQKERGRNELVLCCVTASYTAVFHGSS